MRCTECNRPLIKPAATIKSRRGAMNYGPACAKRAGLLPQRTRKHRRVQSHPVPERDPRQCDWVDQLKEMS